MWLRRMVDIVLVLVSSLHQLGQVDFQAEGYGIESEVDAMRVSDLEVEDFAGRELYPRRAAVVACERCVAAGYSREFVGSSILTAASSGG